VIKRRPIIHISGLRTRLGGQLIHDDLELDVYRGEVMGVVGGSGTGKSVLMRTIIGLTQPEAGRIEVFGTDLLDVSAAEHRSYEEHWGVLFQDGALFTSLTVAENVMVPLREHLTLSDSLMREIAALKIAMVGLPPESGSKYPSELSGGMRKRAALARALAMDPEIVFLDEPTAGLDPISAAAYDELIGRLQGTLGLTVFMVTHDLDSLHTICDRIAVLADHHVVAVGNLEQMNQHEHPWIRAYFNGPRGRATLQSRRGTDGHPSSQRPVARN
jgi:phospholipid/cholesterol/gamma-HCH transport system ATP-binding protein